MEVIDLLKQLIACRSLTPADGGSLNLIGGLLQSAGFQLRRLPAEGVDNLLAYRGKSIRFLFAGHVDVVPPGDLEQWDNPPFSPLEKDGCLYGRGAADMKSAVAAMVAALLKTARDDIGIFLTSDEEGEAQFGTRYFVEWWEAQKEPNIEYCLVGEPSSGDVFGDAIKIGRRGSLTGRLSISGKQVHAAYAWRGDNPAHRLVCALQQLSAQWQDNLAAQGRGEMVTTFQIVELKSGVGADNVTPPSAQAIFNYRYAPPDSEQQLVLQTAALLNKTVGEQRWSCQWRRSAEPYSMPSDCKLATALHNVIRTRTGVSAQYSSSGGTSDGRFLRHICNQLVEFGVINKTIHAPNECVNIADVRQLTNIYQQLAETLA